MALHSDDIVSTNNLASLYLNFGKNDLALKYFKQAIAINPNSPSVNEIYLNLLKYAHKTCGFHSIEEFMPKILSLKNSLPSSLAAIEKYEEFKGGSLAEKELSCQEDKQLQELSELTHLTQTLKEVARVQRPYKIY